jgi:hypothetical protein
MTIQFPARIAGAALLVSVLAGCGTMGMPGGAERADANKVAFSTQLRGANEVPPVVTMGFGQVDAVLNKDTNLLRWKLSYSGLSGPATAGHFHGPASVGANAGVVLPFPGQMSSPMEGSATLTAAQVADLMAGRWYANIHTAANPAGEIRGQMTMR